MRSKSTETAYIYSGQGSLAISIKASPDSRSQIDPPKTHHSHLGGTGRATPFCRAPKLQNLAIVAKQVALPRRKAIHTHLNLRRASSRQQVLRDTIWFRRRGPIVALRPRLFSKITKFAQGREHSGLGSRSHGVHLRMAMVAHSGISGTVRNRNTISTTASPRCSKRPRMHRRGANVADGRQERFGTQNARQVMYR
jgi:hypothetical protein